MPVKKLDVKKAIERELYEPKLSDPDESKVIREDIKQKKDANEVTFEIKLKAQSIEKNIEIIVKNIELGMTPDEVIKVAGEPDSMIEWYTGNIKLKYDNVWVVIENGGVTCLVHTQHFNKYWGRNNYHMRSPEAIIK